MEERFPTPKSLMIHSNFRVKDVIITTLTRVYCLENSNLILMALSSK